VADHDSVLEEALRDRYVIERELGRGGMATVYLARDLKHDRLVALKVLQPDLAATLGPERFLREIRLAARLQHPHILSVHDSGEAAGQLWFTMPYVEGDSLRERLKRERQLPVEDAVRITREAAQALDYAHQHGVIHRDIKPENILLTKDGNVLVSDFGIARALGGDERLTVTGLSVGTPAYMSPEQAAGERAIDARTDVYSLATLLYEMLAGEPPFTGPTAQAIIAKRFGTPPTPIRVVRPDVPESIELALTTALALPPAGRYASTGEFATALKTPQPHAKSDTHRIVRIAAIIIGIVLLAGAGWTLLERRRVNQSRAESHESRGMTRLAVLPFENLGDTADAYFADGVSDEVHGKLSALSGLEVIARTSSGQYRGTTKPAQQIGQELGVQYLLTGTVRWQKRPGSNRVRVSPELVDARTGVAKWQAPFDASISDVFQVQGEIAGRVADALNLALGSGERQGLAARPTGNVEAYDAFLRGEAATRHFGTRDVVALRRGLPSYEQAVALDSTFAVAWGRISRTHSILFFLSTSDPADSTVAEQTARRAVRLAPELADGRLALSFFYGSVVGDQRRALEELRKARELAPNDANLIGAMAGPEQSLGQLEQAAQHARESFRLDPRSVRAATRLARNLIPIGRFDEALAAAETATRLDPSSPDALYAKMLVHVARGNLPAVRAVYEHAPPEIDRPAMVAQVAHLREMAWTLGPGDLDLLVKQPLEAFAGERSNWGLALMQGWLLKGDTARARIYADTARVGFERIISRRPGSSQDLGLLGLCLAYLGQPEEAIATARRAVALVGPDSDRNLGAYNQLQLARVYAITGRRDQAIEALAKLLEIRMFITPGSLQIDPTFASLKSDPRFQRLIRD
jgi:eukaryotic-like serine/threonine-protein kinase